MSSTSAEITNTDHEATLAMDVAKDVAKDVEKDVEKVVEKDAKNEDPEDIIPNSYRPTKLTAEDVLKLSERCKALFMIPSHSLVQFPPATRSNNRVTLDDVNRKVTLHGWLEVPKRKIGKGFQFVRLRDTEGNLIQLSCSDNILPRNIRSESTVAVTGILDLRPEGHRREGQEQFELKVSKIHLLNNVSFTLPFQPSRSKTVNLVTRAKYRYLELRNPLNHSYLRLRDDVIASCRQFLRTDGFMEIETPLLFKSTPEGAREFIVPTRRKGKVYALPQSPQQYKQILMASGIAKYFQVAKCFRDENLRADRQPEFTQVLLSRKKLTSSWIWRWHSLGVRR